MPRVWLACSQCRHEFDADVEAGQNAVCPSCGQPVPAGGADPLPPPMPPAMPAEWFLARGSEKYGPYSIAQMADMVQNGTVAATDLVWKDGLANWVEARTVNELFPPSSPRLPDSPMTAAIVSQPAYPVNTSGIYLIQPYREGGPGFWYNVWINLRRAFSWNLRFLPITSHEQTTLNDRGITNEIGQKLIVWRRSVFLLVAIITGLSFLIHFILALAEDKRGTSTLGVFVNIIKLFAQLSMPVMATLACVFWSRVRLTRTLMLIGWLVAFTIPMMMAFFPVHMLVDMESQADAQTRETLRNPEIKQLLVGFFGLIGGLVYLIELLPAVIALIPGFLRACARIKALFPESVLPGWFLIASAPFYLLLMLVLFIVLNQLASHFLLILSLVFLGGSPVIYFIFAKTFTRPLLEESEYNKLHLAQLIYAIVGSVGVVLLIVYLFNATFFGRNLMGFSRDKALFLPWKLVQFYIDVTGRSLFTTVLFSELVLLVNISIWNNLKLFSNTEKAEQYDKAMEELKHSVR